MTKSIINLNNVQGWGVSSGVAYGGGTVTIDVPVGPTYHTIWLQANAGTSKKMADLIGDIRIKINGKVQRVHSAVELNTLNQLHGSQYGATLGATNASLFVLPIFFAEPWRKNLAAQEGLAWGTKDVSTFQIEVDIKADTFTSPVALTAKAEIDNGPSRDLGVITKVFSTQIPVASGWNDFTNFPKRDAYAQISIWDSNSPEFEVKVNNETIRQATDAANAAHLGHKDMFPKAAASGDVVDQLAITHIVFDVDDIPGNALAMVRDGKPVRDFNVRLNTTSTGTVKALYQLQGFAE
jgi:Viral coat protein P2 N-terminal domain